MKRLVVKKGKAQHIITSHSPPAVGAPKPRLSICITSHDDNEELQQTVQSALATAKGVHEIVVVDDASPVPAPVSQHTVHHRSDQRAGVGPSRDFAATMATGDYVLLTDSHMRFEPGWYENIMDRLGEKKTAWCGSCLGLSKQNMDITKFQGAYTGARLVLYESNPKDGDVVFEGKWTGPVGDSDDYEISCMMGACYFIHRDWYHELGGLGMLKMWGSDEPYLSAKIWLGGGELRLARSVRIGHQFRDASPYTVHKWCIGYNKLRAIKELLGDKAYRKLRDKLPNDVWTRRAVLNLHADESKVLADRERNSKTFTRTVEWLCDRFNLNNPNADTDTAN